MMASTVELRLLLSVDPAAANKVTHVAEAITALQSGQTFCEVSRMIRSRFSKSRSYAWHIVSIARDISNRESLR